MELASAQIETLFAEASSSLRNEVRAALPDEVSLTFELTGEGGGVWTLAMRDEEVCVLRAAAIRPDCRLRCSTDDFRLLLTGQLDATDGYTQGRVSLEGDVGLLLRLGTALRRHR